MIEFTRQRFQSLRVCAARGSVLIFSLVFLVILTLAATTALRSSIVEMRMAANEEARFTRLESTQSIVEQVVSNPDNFIVEGGVGYKNCTSNVSGCDRNSINIETALLRSTDINAVSVIVERQAPVLSSAPRTINTSADAFGAARFEVYVDATGTASGNGAAEIVQGVLVLVPRRVQTN